MKFNFKLFGREVGIIASSRKVCREPVQGVTNRTMDGLFVVFLDYDEIPVEWLEGELNSLQDEFNLGDFHVFKSSDTNHHAVCFDKVTRETYQRILSRSSCDPYYKKVPFVFGKRLGTLRASSKKGKSIIYYKALKGHINEYFMSTAHKKFFSGHHKEMCFTKKNEDGLTGLIMASYKI